MLRELKQMGLAHWAGDGHARGARRKYLRMVGAEAAF